MGFKWSSWVQSSMWNRIWEILILSKLLHEPIKQTWNLSKNLHRRIFRLKILHRQFHLISTVLVGKNTKNEWKWRNLHRWQKFYTPAGTDGIDKFHLCFCPTWMAFWGQFDCFHHWAISHCSNIGSVAITGSIVETLILIALELFISCAICSLDCVFLCLRLVRVLTEFLDVECESFK